MRAEVLRYNFCTFSVMHSRFWFAVSPHSFVSPLSVAFFLAVVVIDCCVRPVITAWRC